MNTKNFWRSAIAVGALAFAVAGCQVESNSTTNANNATTTNTNVTTTATPAATPNVTFANAGASNLPVTLPVLDAMFADEGFAADLKSRLQLNDEQIERLRRVAREDTAGLRESRGDADYSGSTTQATERAAAQIKDVLGADKATQFSDFVRARWNNGGDEAANNGGGSGDTTANGNNTSTSGAAGTNGNGNVAANRPNAVPTDTRIVVNAPAYRMDVFENGQLVKTYKVGIGYPEFPLPTGLRKANTIIFNPTWTPPDEPWVESPTSKVKVGQKVEAGSALNPLGPVKIPIGSPSLIHGGKLPAKLGGFASHGCVGLTNAQVQDVALVMAKIGGTPLTPEDVLNYAKTKTETKNIKLDHAVPVELRYETIVVEDGKLHIYRDVYDKDTNTEENLRAVLDANGVSFDSLTEPERARISTALQQMARDATGKPTNDAAALSANTNANANNANKNANAKAMTNQSDADSRRVTRTIKGQKEIVIELAALKGKGYPAPVAYDTGSGKATASAAPPRKRK